MWLVEFLLGPSEVEKQSKVPVDFVSTGVAGESMGVLLSQNGYLSEEQLEQFKIISKNAEENTKRVKVATELIKKIDVSETEVCKEVYQTLNTLERNSFKRAEYQAERRKEHSLMQKKFKELRSGI